MRADTNIIQIFKIISYLAMVMAMALAATADAAAKRPTINSVTVEVGDSATMLSINGAFLCVPDKNKPETCKTAPVLNLAGETLDVVSSSPTQIIVTSTNTNSGDYTLRLTNSGGKTLLSYDLTISLSASRGGLSATVVNCAGTPVAALAYVSGLGVSGYTAADGGIYLNDIPTGSRNLVIERKDNPAVSVSQSVDVTAGQVTALNMVSLENFQTNAQHCGTCNNVCVSGICDAGQCVAPVSCSDATKNGSETDVDCGGAVCPKCGTGKACLIGSDCVTSYCQGLVCQI